MKVRDLDVVFLSYDEPNADAHWEDLKAKCPWAKRVHGVKGLDLAHKEAARAASTDHFITIDGDCIVNAGFFEIDIDDALISDQALIYWPSRIDVNGLVYGAGSIKCWPRVHVLTMRSHESADPEERSVDFPYNTDWNCEEALRPIDAFVPFAEVYCNGTPLHAFRSGFRAGVRHSISEGRRSLRNGRTADFEPSILHWLQVWLNVGADSVNGRWSIYGARLGCWKVSFEDWDYIAINDFDWFDRYWHDEVVPRFMDEGETSDDSWNDDALADACAALGCELREQAGLAVVELDAAQSAFMKSIYSPISSLNCLDRMGTMFRRGVGVQSNAARSADYHIVAAAAGQSNAMNALARIYMQGVGRPRDQRRAIELWQESHAQGNPFAAYELGKLWRKGWGWGIAKDPQQAMSFFRIACDRGHEAAHAELAEMYLAGEGGDSDRRRALFHLTLAGLEDDELRRRARILSRELRLPSIDSPTT